LYTTAPSRDIAALLALDSIEISQKEAKKAIYSSTDVKNMIKHTICLDYEEVTDITPDIRLTLYNAGHTLGSALAHLHIGNGLHNFLYSGDFLFDNTNLLTASSTRFPRLETVMMESTYGKSTDVFPTRKECEDYLMKIIKDTIAKRGKILMPVLGVGRSQEIMLIIEKAIEEGKLEKMPIFVQGMVWDITAIHTAYPDFFNARVKKSIFHKEHNPFLSDIFKRIVGRKEMEQVVNEEGPCVIIATSGMMTGGPSVEYFRHLADNPNNSLVFTSYQGEGSLGRKISEGEKVVVLNGGEKPETINVKMAVHMIRGFSGHSNFNQLVGWVRYLEPSPKKVIVIHGESSKCLELASTLHKTFRIETVAPRNLESIRIK